MSLIWKITQTFVIASGIAVLATAGAQSDSRLPSGGAYKAGTPSRGSLTTTEKKTILQEQARQKQKEMEETQKRLQDLQDKNRLEKFSFSGEDPGDITAGKNIKPSKPAKRLRSKIDP